MTEITGKILARKAHGRERIVGLPFDQKIAMLEKLRDRGLLFQRPTVVAVSGNAVVLSASGARVAESTPPLSRQLQGPWNTLQNSKTVFVELRKRPERWLPVRVARPINPARGKGSTRPALGPLQLICPVCNEYFLLLALANGEELIVNANAVRKVKHITI